MDMKDLKDFVVGMQLIDQRKQVMALWEGKEVGDVFQKAMAEED
jgi:hypothetical protein